MGLTKYLAKYAKDYLEKQVRGGTKKVFVPVLQNVTKEDVRQSRRAVEHGVTDAGLLKHVGTMVDVNPDYVTKVGFAEMSGIGRILAGRPTNLDLLFHPITGMKWAGEKEQTVPLRKMFTESGRSAIESVNPKLLEWTVKVDPKAGANGSSVYSRNRITVGTKDTLGTLTHEMGHPMGDALNLPRGPANSDGRGGVLQPFIDELEYRTKLKRIWNGYNHFADSALRQAKAEGRKAAEEIEEELENGIRRPGSAMAYSFYARGADELRNEALASMAYGGRKFLRIPVRPGEPAGGAGHIMTDVNGYYVTPPKVMSIAHPTSGAGRAPTPQKMFHQDAKGGDNFKNARALLATDRVPDTIFGIPVVSRPDDYTEADIAFFREHPEAGGYYDMGEGDESEQAAEKAGLLRPDQYTVPMKANRVRDILTPEEEQRRFDRAMKAQAGMMGAALAAPVAAKAIAASPVLAGLAKTAAISTAKQIPVAMSFDLLSPEGRKNLRENPIGFVGDSVYEAGQLALMGRMGMLKSAPVIAGMDFAKSKLEGEDNLGAAVDAGVGTATVGALSGYEKLVGKIPIKPLRFALGLAPVAAVGASLIKKNLFPKQEDAKGGTVGVDPRNIKGTKIAINPKRFDTPLPYGREREYRAWRATLPKPLQYDGDYDLQGYFLDRDTVKTAVSGDHFIDKYKKPNHPTFSTESQYSKGVWAKYAPLAGTWNGNEYVPSDLVRAVADRSVLADRINTAVGQAIPFIKEHEGFRDKAYKDPVGKWTVGYGQTEIDGRAVREGDVIDEPSASRFVERRVRKNAADLYRLHSWTNAASANALSALYDIAYNAGVGVLSEEKSPTLNRTGRAAATTNDVDNAIWAQVPTYIRADGKVLKGLKTRRQDAIDKWRK